MKTFRLFNIFEKEEKVEKVLPKPVVVKTTKYTVVLTIRFKALAKDVLHDTYVIKWICDDLDSVQTVKSSAEQKYLKPIYEQLSSPESDMVHISECFIIQKTEFINATVTVIDPFL
jgi:hypothetical protein